MDHWSFLTKHAWALLLIAQEPQTRLRDIATSLDVTERTAYGLVADLTEAGYLVKSKDGRRNRYSIQSHLPLRDPLGRERTIGEILDLLRGVGEPNATGSSASSDLLHGSAVRPPPRRLTGTATRGRPVADTPG